MNLFSQNHNKRTRFTRMCIGEAVFSLMDKKEYEKIKVSDIVKRAGVSRVTFYHYYETKEDALTDFFHEIVAGYIRECREELGIEVRPVGIRERLTHTYPEIQVELTFFDAEITEGEPEARVHTALVWAAPEKWDRYPVCPADRPLI